MDLRLVVADRSAAGWTWQLVEPSGTTTTLVVDTAQNTAAERHGFEDIATHVRRHHAPDLGRARVNELARQVGAWMGEHVFGDIGARLSELAPCTVLLELSAAPELAFRPWELAIIGGHTLAERGVTFVVSLDGTASAPDPDDVGSPLRVLALFSQPRGMDALNLRKERRRLSNTFDRLAAAGHAVELRVLQWGVTQAAIAEAVADEAGWTVIHLAGHGSADGFVVETDEGGRDILSADDLADLLQPARGRTRLVTLTSCQSAAQLTAARLGMFDLGPVEPDEDSAASASHVFGSVATTLAQRLSCAVVAMRFPVSDEFAIAFSQHLYEEIANKSLLPRALDAARRRAHEMAQGTGLDWATPTVVGRSAASLRLTPPRHDGPRPRRPKAALPRPAERFVGRREPMRRCGRVVLGDGTATSVLLVGMPGVGKSATARELVDRHADAFDHVLWFSVEDAPFAPDRVLADVARALEPVLPERDLLTLLTRSDEPGQFGDAVRAALRAARVLLVLDNLERVLDDEGRYQQPSWAEMVKAVLSHEGTSRTIMASRIAPADLTPDFRSFVHVEPLGALDQPESMLLTLELPRLNALLGGTADGMAPDRARALAKQVIEATRGHPGLMELADGQAERPELLRGLLQSLADTDGSVTETTYVGRVTWWTQRVRATMDDQARRMLDLLSWLSAPDRRDAVLRALCHDADWPSAVSSLLDLALVSVDEAEDGDRLYTMHPLIADVVRAEAAESREEVLRAAASYWRAATADAVAAEEHGGASMAVAWAARSATDYLLAIGDTAGAVDALDLVLRRERSYASITALMPALDRVVKASTDGEGDLRSRRLVANALSLLHGQPAERVTRELRRRALESADLAMAASLTADLIGECREAGRLDEAADLADELIDLGARAGVGPWTAALHQVQRLNILVTSGRLVDAQPEIDALRSHLATLPPVAGPNETVRPYWVQELFLDTLYSAAMAASDWERALRVGEEVVARKRARGASEADTAEARFRVCAALARLRRLEEAAKHLVPCRDAFARDRNLRALGAATSLLAEIEEKLGRVGVAIELSRDALRYDYAGRMVSGMLTGHLNLGNRIARVGRIDEALIHHIAAALLGVVSGHHLTSQAVGTLAFDLIARPDPATWPRTVPALVTQVADASGVDLDEAFARLQRRPEKPDLDDVLERARRQAHALLAPNLAFWDPVLAALSASGEPSVAEALHEQLDILSADPSWTALVAALRELSRNDPVYTAPTGLDEIDSAVFRRAVAVLQGGIILPAMLWCSMPLSSVLGNVVGATYGRKDRSAEAAVEMAGLRASADEATLQLVERLEWILDGRRDDALTDLESPVADAIQCVLTHAAALAV